jgi:uncharacterized protein YukJ
VLASLALQSINVEIAMPLPGYGLLIGTITSSRPQSGGNPHWLLMVQPADKSHPPYRVAVNLQSSVKGSDPEVEYQAIDVNKDGLPGLQALAQTLTKNGATPNFIRAADDPTCPVLDFVRGGLIDTKAFVDVPQNADPFRDAFVQALKTAGQNKNLVAVFGTGYPNQASTGKASPTGYQGVDNIHMNQGSFRATGGASHYLENGPNQDGGLVFLLPKGPVALFVKFHTQSTQTDGAGNPTNTGIPELDAVKPAIRRALFATPHLPTAQAPRGAAAAAMPTAAAAARAVAKGQDAVVSTAPTDKFVFNDQDPNDPTAAFVADDDQGAFRTKFVMQYSSGQTKGPVPKPRRYPTLDLKSVLGDDIQGHSVTNGAQEIIFDMAGDSGAPTEAKLTGEMQVTELMVAKAKAKKPAFLFHVGDVVYYYGEKPYFFSQFYEPFRAYPAPIFAIPGNHDAITFNENMMSLEAFEAAFCAERPGRWDGAGGVLRSTMIQPGVYFTLDAPLVSIIGLYSNCSESIGWIDEPQVLFLHQELVRLKALREQDGRAVILAVHHCPRWFEGAATKDLMTTAIDNACTEVGFWPDAVICGHAHLGQRMVRHLDKQQQDIPYFIVGASGYGLDARMEVGKNFMATLPNKMKKLIVESGYLRVTVSRTAAGDSSLRLEYFSTKADEAQPRDTCVIDLKSRKMTSPAR